MLQSRHVLESAAKHDFGRDDLPTTEFGADSSTLDELQSQLAHAAETGKPTYVLEDRHIKI